MKVFINGKIKKINDAVTIMELLDKLNIDSNKVVVLVDGKIKKNDFKIKEGTRLDIISFAGGG